MGGNYYLYIVNMKQINFIISQHYSNKSELIFIKNKKIQ